MDDDVYFPCVGVDSSCVQFSVLDSYELNSTQAKSVTSVRGRLAIDAFQSGKVSMLRVLYWKLFEKAIKFFLFLFLLRNIAIITFLLSRRRILSPRRF